MLHFLLYFAIMILSVLGMEIIAIITHKYLMHGPGWFLHKSHHIKNNNKFELNDFYFILFSIPSMLLIIFGLINKNFILLSIGVGILLYGIIYIILHDIIIHRRFGIKININTSYLKKIKYSHLIHHSNKNKKGAKNFGFITY